MKLKKELVIIFCVLIAGIFARRGRVIGGSRTAISDYPHLVSFRTFFNKHFCSGSIISRWHVLSAAHCFKYFNHQYYRIKVYTGTSSSVSTSGDVHEVEHIVFHPQFSWELRVLQTPHDLSVVKLKRPIQFNSSQRKINLPSRDVFDENLGVLAGWGVSHVDYTVVSEKLLKLSAILFDSETCGKRLPFVVHKDQFCSIHMYNNTGPCPVDSGGSVSSNGEIYGVISLTEQCANGLPAVHTKVYSYLGFIRNILGNSIND